MQVNSWVVGYALNIAGEYAPISCLVEISRHGNEGGVYLGDAGLDEDVPLDNQIDTFYLVELTQALVEVINIFANQQVASDIDGCFEMEVGCITCFPASTVRRQVRKSSAYRYRRARRDPE